MGLQLSLAIALGAAVLVAAVSSPVPALSPTPSPSGAPTLAPIDDTVTPGPAPSGSSPGPKVIGHIYTSAFCTSFVEHFNQASRIVIGNDRQLDAVDLNLHKIDDDWNRLDGAMRVFDDRVALISMVDQMVRSIPASQAAVNALLAQAKTTTDPERKAALLESASQLQKTIDRQRAVAYDLTGVIHVLIDRHKREDMAETNINRTLPPGMPPVRISLLDDPVPEPGTDTMMQPAPSPSPRPGATAAPTAEPSPGSVEDILQWTRQRSIMGTAESRAAVAAGHVVRICNQERMPTPPPGIQVPAPRPSSL
jgi:hypothetical protein